MKNLILAASLIATATTGCVITSNPPNTSAVISATWSFDHFADKTPRSCPR
mgnify:CR=1 FL=1